MSMPRMPGFPTGMPRGAMPQARNPFAGAPGFTPQGFGQNLSALQQKYGVDPKKWRCVYPCYLNIKKTLEEGRKIARKYCVEHPHPQDIAEVCKYLGLPFYIELNKTHPRDFFNRSRVRVLLINEDGTLRRQDIKNRQGLLVALGKMIPKLESRKIRLEKQKQFIQKRKQMIQQKQAEMAAKEEQKKFKSSKQKKIEARRNNKSKRGGRSKGRGRGKGKRRGGKKRR
eukprot:258676_1